MASAQRDIVSELEDNFLKCPLQAFINIQALQETQCEENTAEDSKCTGKEQYMQIAIRLPDNLLEQLNIHQSQTHLILVADRSGSMSGQPFEQVKQALLDVVSDSLQDEYLKVDIVVYDHEAEVVVFTAANYRSVIGNLSARGRTNFSAAFEKLNTVIAKKTRRSFDKTVVIFLTDGVDSEGSVKAIANSEKWKTHLRSLDTEVVVHTVGFSSSHDFKFLQGLSKVGSAEGIFRYSEPGDGATALKSKLQELFDFVSLSSGQSVDVVVEMDGQNRIVGTGTVKQSDTIQGQITNVDTDSDIKVPQSIVAESWVYLDDPSSTPEIKLQVLKSFRKDKKQHTVRLSVQVSSVERELITTAAGKVEWAMKILARNTDTLTTKFAETIAKNGNLSKLQPRLDRLQQRITQTPMFGRGVTKEMREMLIGHVRDIQAKIDMMHSMIARYLRGETQSVSMLARAHDLRYEAKFSKGRRQRLMDKRVSKNMSKVKADQKKLETLVVNQEELDLLSQDALDFFFCVLSQNSVKDILTSSDDTENAIGFGLAVKRPEHVLDEPTAIRLQVISGTLASRLSILDALEYKISVDGHLDAHGGFSFEDPLGCATVGLSREPINAWLPLYVTRSHWERVKVLLKPTLGYFCTLDPLGYDNKQMDVLFLVLGSMIGQLNDMSVGEHQLRLLFAVQRTCAATVVDFDLLTQLMGVLKNFVEGPEGRTKDVVPNLCTLVGYLVSLPKSMIRNLLGYNSDTGVSGQLPDKAKAFWVAFTAECLRRSGGNLLRNTTNEALIMGILKQLLHPASATTLDTSRVTTVSRLVVECDCLGQMPTEEIKLKVKEYDPNAGIKLPEITMSHSSDVDKAMETWAQAMCGVIKNKNRADQVLRAKRTVREWLNDGRQQLGLESESTEKQEAVDTRDAEATTETATSAKAATPASCAGSGLKCQDVDATIIELMSKLLERLSRSSFPDFSAIPGFLTFINHWLSCDHSYTEIDKNGGLAPEAWVEGVKAAVAHTYQSMEEFVELCKEEHSEQQSDPDTLVVIGTEILPVETAGLELIVGRAPVKDGHSEEDGSDDDFSGYYDSSDEDTPQKVSKRLAKTNTRHVTVPMILHCIDSNIGQVNMIRAMLCQAVEFHTNSRARAGIKGGQLCDLGNNYGNAMATLQQFSDVLDQRKENAVCAVINRMLWQRANYSMLHAETVWAFIGYLMNYYKARDEGFSELVHSIVRCDSGASIPLLPDKLRVMLSGKWEDCAVLANGNIWLPEKKLTKRFEELLGTEVWSEMEVDLLSNVQIHVYRESDIPNRHGHCNSNPYIPNSLRKKLGMPLLPELGTGARTSKNTSQKRKSGK